MAETTRKVKHVRGETFVNGTTSICKKRIYTYADGTQETKEEHIPLKEITPEECFHIRETLKPGFILKKDQHIYFADLSKEDISSSTLGLGNHLCFECKNCSSKPKQFGGCPKVMDPFPSRNTGEMGRWDDTNLCRIEKYPFVTLGYERFNCPSEALYVFLCENFEKGVDSPKKRSISDRVRIKRHLRDYLEDF